MIDLLRRLLGNTDQAFGLPKGTVRGGIFLMVTGTICWMSLAGGDVPGYLVAAWGTITGYYFGQKRADAAQPTA